MKCFTFWIVFLVSVTASLTKEFDNKTNFIPDIINKECLQTGICEDVPNYPAKYIADILKDKLIPKLKRVRIHPDDHMLMPLCEHHKKRIVPKAARDDTGKWYFVLNRKHNPLYIFVVVRCTSNTCRDFLEVEDSFTRNLMKCVCVQKYTSVAFKVLEWNGHVVTKLYSLPSCCNCVACFVDLFTCNQFVPVIPQECEALGVCDQVPNYPHEHISRILTELENKGQIWLNGDGLDKNFNDEPYNAVNICSSRIKTISPQAARDEDDEWYFVLNRSIRPVQTVTLEICNHLNEECGKDVGSIKIIMNHRNRSYCKQEHINLELFGLDKDGNVKLILPFLPCCCTCQVNPE